MRTPEQDAVIQAALDNLNVFMPATAGSGKSFTLREVAKVIRGQSLYVTFGRRNADEAATYMPSHVTCASFHQLGYRSLKAYLESVGTRMHLNEHKWTAMYLKPLTATDRTWPDGADGEIAGFLAGLHELRLNHGLSATAEGVTALLALAEDRLDLRALDAYHARRGRHLTDPAFLAQILAWGAQESRRLALLGHVTFQECLTLPLELGLVRPLYAWVLVDEAQDLNCIQHAWVKRLGKRYAVAGDEHQSIMGFTGSNRRLMRELAADLGCVERPLSVSFRCAEQVVALARPFTDQIEAAPGAVTGELKYLRPEEMGVALRGGDLILARNNSTLVRAAFRMAREGFPVTVKGRDLPARMVRTLRRFLSPAGTALLPLEQTFTLPWLQGQVQPALADMAAQLQAGDRSNALTSDVLQCALEAAEEAARQSPGEPLTLARILEVAGTLFQAFSPSVSLNFMTAHAAKGLEANRVAILTADFPSPRALDPEEERNLIFVALTRARQVLLFISEDGIHPEWTKLPDPHDPASVPVPAPVPGTAPAA